MSGIIITKATLASRLRGLVAGTQKHPPGGPLTLGSATYTAATLVQKLKELADALDAADAAKASWQDALTRLTDTRANVGPLVGDYVKWVLVTYGNTPSMLADYGVTPPKARTPLTAEQKATAALKRKATREARHTMGPKKKKTVKGTLAQAAPSTPSTTSPPIPPSPAASAPTGGTGAAAAPHLPAGS